MRRFTLVSVLLFVAVAACGEVFPTDAESRWCPGNRDRVETARQTLDLKDHIQVWAEGRGVEYDESGDPIPSEELDNVVQEIRSGNFGGDGPEEDLWEAWLDQPDGIRSCRAAFDAR